jgi:hypothetical protein
MIIRKIALSHCQRGPERCEKCRAVAEKKLALLELDPEGDVARRVIRVEGDGKATFHEFEIARFFESREEAQAYAREHGVTDAIWE